MNKSRSRTERFKELLRAFKRRNKTRVERSYLAAPYRREGVEGATFREFASLVKALPQYVSRLGTFLMAGEEQLGPTSSPNGFVGGENAPVE